MQGTVSVNVKVGHDDIDTVAAVTMSNGREVVVTALLPNGEVVEITASRSELLAAWLKRS